MTATRSVAPVPRLAPAAVAMLESLYQHRLLSTRQLHELHTPDASMRWTQRVIRDLRDAELVAVARLPRGGLGVWFLTARGIEAAEEIPHRAETRRKVIGPEQAGGPLQAHTLAVNEVGVAFVRAARERGHECGPYAWRHEIAHPIASPRRRGEQLIADAVLAYQLVEPGQPVSFHYRFIELDRATVPVDDLAVKLGRYAQLYRYTPATKGYDAREPLWTQRYAVFPTVLVVLAGESRDRLERRRRTVLALCREDAELSATPEVEIAVCLLEDLAALGPFAPIFDSLDSTSVSWLGEEKG